MIGFGRPDNTESMMGDPSRYKGGPAAHYLTSEQLGFVVGLGDTETEVFLVPQQSIYLITVVEIFNRDGSDRTVTFRVIPPDVLTSDASYDFDELVCYPRIKEVRAFDQVYPAGYRMVALADAPDVVNVRVHGMNLVQQ